MVPEDLHYSDEHEWVRLDDDIATIGITDYAQDQLGDIVYVELPEPGEEVVAGNTVGELESTKSVSDIYAPLSGTIIARNDGLESNPEVVNSDPYGEGWLFKVRVSEDDPLEGLHEAEEYARLTAG
ncbi:glycine cleavage system protein GcvH [soil metagenome]